MTYRQTVRRPAMLEWHQVCLKMAAEGKSEKEFLDVIQEYAYDINAVDEHRMTLLMHLVSHKNYKKYCFAILKSSEATLKSLRKHVDLTVMNLNGEDAFLLAAAAGNTVVQERMDVERAQQERLKASNDIFIGYHDTSSVSYDFIMKDQTSRKFPMIGGAGGYFGGGVYFAVTKEQSTTKALSHGFGFECRLKMGNIYKISSVAERDAFRQTYFGTSAIDSRTWYKTPSDVIRMRLLTKDGKFYDSVWGHYDDSIPIVTDRILPTGDEYVVYSADQVQIQKTFIVFNNHWLPKNLSVPPIYDTKHQPSLRDIQPGDVVIYHNDEKDENYTNDALMFAYKDTQGKIQFTNPILKEDGIVIPLDVCKDIKISVMEHFKPILSFVSEIHPSPSDVYFKTLFPGIPPAKLVSTLQMYRIFIALPDAHHDESKVIFKHTQTDQIKEYKINKERTSFFEPSDTIYETLSTKISVVTFKYNVTIDGRALVVKLPMGLAKSLKQLADDENLIVATGKNETKFMFPGIKESIVVSKLKALIENYLRRTKTRSPRKPTPPPPAPVVFQPTATQRSYAKYFVSELEPTRPGFSIPNETLQHGDIIALKGNEERVWFYNCPLSDKKISMYEVYINPENSILRIPIEITQHLSDTEHYYKSLLTKLKWIKAKTIHLVISPNDVFWKNKKLFTPKVIEKAGTLLDYIRQHHYTMIDYSSKYTLLKKYRSKGHILIQENKNTNIFKHIIYTSLQPSNYIIEDLNDVYWNPDPLTISMDVSLHSSNGETIPFTNIFDRTHIQDAFPNQPIQWTIEGTAGQPSKLVLQSARYTFEETKKRIQQAIERGEDWLPFGGRWKESPKKTNTKTITIPNPIPIKPSKKMPMKRE